MKTKQGFIHLFLLLVLVLGLVVFVTASKVPVATDYSTNVKGLFIAKGDEDSNRTSGESGESKAQTTTTVTPTSTTQQTENGNSNETSKNSSETQQRNTGVATRKKTEVKNETKNEKVETRTETEIEKNIPEQESPEIEDQNETPEIEVATESGKTVVMQKGVRAISNFPLEVNPTTNELQVTTPAGTKTVTVLPDQAVQNMLAAHVINRIAPSSLNEQVKNQTAQKVTTTTINLEERNSTLVYKIKGIKDRKLFGIIPVTTQMNVFVSAQNGTLVSQEETLLTRIIDVLSQ